MWYSHKEGTDEFVTFGSSLSAKLFEALNMEIAQYATEALV